MKKIALLVVLLVAFAICLPSVRAATEAEIDTAIARGLEWLKAQQNMTPGPNYGSWGKDSDPYPTRVARTGLAVKKFEHYALEQEILPLDPAYEYYEQVKYGLNFLFSRAATQVIGIQMHDGNPDNPDSDGDSIGIYFVGPANGTNYETGIALMAIAENNCPDSVVNTGDPGNPIEGETYYDVVDNVVDYLAWGQNEAEPDRGGWRYAPNSGSSDQSVSGYVTLGLAYAQAPAPHGFGLPLPDFVKTELQRWIDYIQCDTPGGMFGGSGYSAPCDGYTKNMLTGNLLFEMALNGQTNGQAWEDAVAYIVNHWAGIPWVRGYQGMYCVMKGFEFQDMPDTLPNSAIDWYADLADYIVANQNTTPGPMFGSWPANLDYGDEVLTTAWALLTLEKAAPPPVEISVNLDIKPQSCPNPFNTKARGVLPVAILGTEDFDVMLVDPATVLLEGVSPLRWDFEDVSTPVGPDADTCDCTTDTADGYMDLTLKFDHQEILDSIAPVFDREVRVLTLTGMTYDSTDIRGHDCVVIGLKGPLQAASETHNGFTVSSNYPNPFNPETEISFSVPQRMQVSLVIYNILGEKVKTLVSGEIDAGTHSIHWNGRDEAGNSVASGIYFYRLKAEGFDQTMKMILMK